MDPDDAERIRHGLLLKVRERGPTKTICPSEVARALGGSHWRDWMPQVRQIGGQLTQAGEMSRCRKVKSWILRA